MICALHGAGVVSAGCFFDARKRKLTKRLQNACKVREASKKPDS